MAALFSEANIRAPISPASCARVKNILDQRRGLRLKSQDLVDVTPLKFLNVERLDLSDNPQIDPSGLGGMSSLKQLMLLDCGLREVPSFTGDLPALAYLDVSGNSIKRLDNLPFLSGLSTIGLADNQISDVEPLLGFNNLEYVDLSTNRISAVDDLLNIDSDSINVYGNKICDQGKVETLESAEQEFIGVGQQFCF